MMFMPFLFLPATSITCLRSSVPKDGYSPVVPNTTMPSAPLCLNQASTSLKAPGSNLRYLSQGVQLATQNRVLALLPRLRAPCAIAGPAIASAAAPPISEMASLRVPSMTPSSRIVMGLILAGKTSRRLPYFGGGVATNRPESVLYAHADAELAADGVIDVVSDRLVIEVKDARRPGRDGRRHVGDISTAP